MSAKILIVDDEKEFREFMVATLTSREFQVVCAENGEEAIDKAREETPDLVFMDLNMPGRSGWDAVKEIRSIPTLSHVKIVATTGLGLFPVLDALEIGCDDYLLKPFNISDLQHVIETFLPDDSRSGV